MGPNILASGAGQFSESIIETYACVSVRYPAYAGEHTLVRDSLTAQRRVMLCSSFDGLCTSQHNSAIIEYRVNIAERMT
jgi:hypothetical protein